jgi:hypothetical protein
MAEPHEHVDLDVLHLVERLLRRDDHEAPAVADPPAPAPRLAAVPELDEGDPASHPAAHVPGRGLITKQPVTPLPRRR